MMKITGLIPAGGVANRLGKLPCSKEILPVKITADYGVERNINVVSEYLLNAFRTAGISNVFFILRRGKWDIPEYYGDGSWLKMNIGYLMMNLPHGIPFTLDQAYNFTSDHYIALGFPDIVFYPGDAIKQLKDKIIKSTSDLMLGLVPVSNPEKVDMIEFDSNNKISEIVIKQPGSNLQYGWFFALWSPKFWGFFHKMVQENIKENKVSEEKSVREIYPGDIFNEALKKDFKIDYMIFEDGYYTDIGTPDDLEDFLK